MKFVLISLPKKLSGLDSVPSDPAVTRKRSPTYRGASYRGTRATGVILLRILGDFLRPPSHENSEVLLPRILILPDLKRAALPLWRPFHRVRPVDFGSPPAAPRRRLRVARVASLFRGAPALCAGLRGVRGAPLQPDARVPHQPVPLRAGETEVEVTAQPRSARLRLLQLEDEAALPGTSRSIRNMLQGPAPGLRRRRVALAVGPEGRQPHLAHVGAGGAVLDPQPPATLGAPGGSRLGLEEAVAGGGVRRSAATRAIELRARSPGHPRRRAPGALGFRGFRGLRASGPTCRARVAVWTLGRRARVGGPVCCLALQRDLHGGAAGGPCVERAQELRDEHGRAALERAHGLLQATAVLRAVLGEGVRAAPPRQRVECHEKVVFPLLV